MIKRFILFNGEVYYAAGGWHDKFGCYDTLEEASNVAAAIMDTDNGWY